LKVTWTKALLLSKIHAAAFKGLLIKTVILILAFTLDKLTA